MRRRAHAQRVGLLVALIALLVALRAVASQAAPASAPAPSVAASAPPPVPASAAASSAAAPAVEAVVRLKDRKVFILAVGHEKRAALDRARDATQALERAFDGDDREVRVERKGASAIVFAGKTPIVELYDDDAAAAHATLDTYAADVAAKVDAAMNQEKKRSAIANTVFSFSLVVFGALIAFLLVGKASQMGKRARDWIEENPDRIPVLRVGGIELLRPAAIEALVTIAIGVAKRIAQFGLLYAWAIFSLSLFEPTRGYTDKLTSLVLGPLTSFVARVGTGLPLAIVTAIAVVATALLVRFTGVFFAGVARGETTVDWVPQDLAAPVGVIVRIGIVVAALLLASPLLTGTEEGALSRAGAATLVAFGLAAAPVLASGVIGAIVVFERRLRVGDFVELAGRTGRIRGVTLLEITVEDDSGCEVRIPHLASIWHPTRVLGPAPVVVVELVVDPQASQVKVRDVLADAAHRVGTAIRVDLLSIDADGALYRVAAGIKPQILGPTAAPVGRRARGAPRKSSIPPPPAPPEIFTRSPSAVGLGHTTTVQLTSLLADALMKEGIRLGRRSIAIAGARGP